MEDNKAVIDSMDNALFVKRDGILYLVPMPPEGFGKQIITWENGKPHLKCKYENVVTMKEIG